MNNLPQSFQNLLAQVRTASDIPEPAKQKIEQQILSLPRPTEWDVWIYRIVVAALASVALLSISFSFVIYFWRSGNGAAEVRIPEIMIALGSAAVGALAGLLAPSPSGRTQV